MQKPSVMQKHDTFWHRNTSLVWTERNPGTLPRRKQGCVSRWSWHSKAGWAVSLAACPSLRPAVALCLWPQRCFDQHSHCSFSLWATLLSSCCWHQKEELNESKGGQHSPPPRQSALNTSVTASAKERLGEKRIGCLHALSQPTTRCAAFLVCVL